MSSSFMNSSKATVEETSVSIVSISEWWHNSNKAPPLSLIDLRSEQNHKRCRIYIPSTSSHYNNSSSSSSSSSSETKTTVILNLPFETLQNGQRSCELPPRHVHFAILLPKEQKEEVMEFFGATRSKSTQQSRQPWKVRQILLDSDVLWDEARSLGICNDGDGGADEGNNDGTYGLIDDMERYRPIPRLWKPDGMVETILLPLLQSRLELVYRKHFFYRFVNDNDNKNDDDKDSDKDWRSTSAITGTSASTWDNNRLQIWDLGSGAGRDVCFLAEELKFHFYSMILNHYRHPNQVDKKHCDDDNTPIMSQENRNEITFSSTPPFQIIGMDNHKGSSRRCVPFWKNRNLEDVTESKLIDLNKIALVHDSLVSLIEKSKVEERLILDVDCAQVEDDANPPVRADTDEDLARSASTTDETFLSNDKRSNHRQKFGKNDYSNNRVICLYAIRYLNRKLLDYLVGDCDNFHESVHEKHPPLYPGTIFATSHFCKESVDSEWNFDHPKKSNVLERNELRNKFEGSGKWKILRDEICLDGDHGRTLIRFVAERV